MFPYNACVRIAINGCMHPTVPQEQVEISLSTSGDHPSDEDSLRTTIGLQALRLEKQTSAITMGKGGPESTQSKAHQLQSICILQHQVLGRASPALCGLQTANSLHSVESAALIEITPYRSQVRVQPSMYVAAVSARQNFLRNILYVSCGTGPEAVDERNAHVQHVCFQAAYARQTRAMRTRRCMRQRGASNLDGSLG